MSDKDTIDRIVAEMPKADRSRYNFISLNDHDDIAKYQCCLLAEAGYRLVRSEEDLSDIYANLGHVRPECRGKKLRQILLEGDDA